MTHYNLVNYFYLSHTYATIYDVMYIKQALSAKLA